MSIEQRPRNVEVTTNGDPHELDSLRKTLDVLQSRGKALIEQAWFIIELQEFAEKTLIALERAEDAIEERKLMIEELEGQVLTVDEAVGDAARRVVELAAPVLGAERVESESVATFDFRRALEDLDDKI